MLIKKVDRLAGRPTGIRLLAACYVACGLLEAGVYICILPVLHAFSNGNYAAIYPWLIGAGICALCGAIVDYASTNWGYLVGTKIVTFIQRRLGDHIVRLPLGWFTREKAGWISALLERDLQMVYGFPGTFLRQIVTAITVPASIAVIYLYLDWRLYLVFIVLLPALWFAAQNMATAAGDGHLAEEEANASLSSRVVEFVQAQPILRASGAARSSADFLQAEIDNDRAVTVETLDKTSRPMVIYTVLCYGVFSLVFLTGVWLLAINALTAIEFLFVIMLCLRFVRSLIVIGSQGMTLRVMQNALDSSDRILSASPLPETDQPRIPHGNSVEFDGVHFSYDSKREVLCGTCFTCPERQFTALVGPSGSGKTTLTRLVARFWDVNTGSVRIGGVDVRDMSIDDLMSRISLVFQDVYLMDGTIEDNIRVGAPDATDEAVRTAARIARLDEVAERLEDGWDTRVGERGSRLSGGERQRVAIARALLKNAPIVLFDEATSALDAENEAAIAAAIQELAKERTVIAIAHRLSTIAGADQIVMLENGKVTQRGTHEELIKQLGRYQNFWNERERAQGWRISV